MSLSECIVTAFANVLGHKLRSSLTMLGIIIGISSVIMITSIGTGVKNTVFDTVSNINRSLVQIYATGSGDDSITFEDAEAILQIKNVAKVGGLIERWGMRMSLRVPGDTEDGSLIGLDENYNVFETYNLSLGRFITKNDVENRSMVAVIRPNMAVKIFGRVNCLGEKIEIDTNYFGKYEFTVVGILQASDESVVGEMVNTPINRALAVIPITAASEIFYTENRVDFLGATLNNAFETKETCTDIINLLKIRHNKTDGFQAESMENSFEEIDTVLSAITGFISFVAAISLFVGGVGVMNIMLVTVRERTREIGIRKSLGATPGVIRLQFLVEAAILSALGGVLGLALGALGARGIGMLLSGFLKTPITPVISLSVISLAIGVSGLVGIIFGVYPAGKAAKLDPLEALRYE